MTSDPMAKNEELRDKFLQQFEDLGKASAPSLEEIMNSHNLVNEEVMQKFLTRSGIDKKPETYAETYCIAWFLYLQGHDQDAILKKLPGLKIETIRDWMETNRWEERRMIELQILHERTEQEMAKLRDETTRSVAEKVSTFTERLEKKIYENIDKLDAKDLLRQFLPAMKLTATLTGEMDKALDDEAAERAKGYRKLNESLDEVKSEGFKPTKPIIEARIIHEVKDEKPNLDQGISERTGDTNSQSYTV